MKSVLLSKSIRTFPQNLIYVSPKVPDCYKMVNAAGEFVGTMHARVKFREDSACYKEFLPCNVFHINSLEIEKKRQGYGSDFVKFAKQESFKKECGGRVSLVAFNSTKSPHIFWWKQGFRSTKAYEMNILRVVRIIM